MDRLLGRRFARVLAVAVGLCLAALLAWQGGLGRVDGSLYDWISRFGARDPRPDVVVVAIDERSLAQVGRWPWPRDQQIDLIERIAAQSPAAVGLDLLLSEPSSDPLVDQRLAEAFRRSGNIVLPFFTAQAGTGKVQAMLPVPPLAAAAHRLGHVSIDPDADGVVRSVYLREGPHGQMWEHFAVALLRTAGALVPDPLPGNRAPPRLPSEAAGDWRRDHWVHVAYAGPAGTYRTLSAADVLAGRVPDDTLRDRIVLIGATATGLGDVYPTPWSGRHRFMPGVEISANVIDNLLSGETRAVMAQWLAMTLSVLLVAAVLPALWLLAPGWALAASAAGVAATVTVSGVLLLGQGVWFPPGAAALSIVAFYVTWNWRRLERAATYLVDELRRLRRHGAVDEPPPPGGEDLIDRRIRNLAHATGRLLNAQAFMSSVIESLPDAVLAVGQDGRVLLSNQAATTRFGTAAGKGAEMSGLLEGWALVGGGALTWPPSVEAGRFAECRDPSGRAFLFEYAPCAGLGEGDAAWIATLVDISALREAERKRDQAWRFLSHDIRSPQAAILALLDLHENDPDELSRDELLARIRRYVLRTQSLAESFVELARLATAPVQEELLDGADVLLDAADECWSLAQAKDIALRTDLPDGAAPLRGERSLLVRALVNLINNAVKFSSPGSPVECRLFSQDGNWCLAVKDRGPGIAPEEQARLFQEFSRVGGASAGEPGFGLGLAFVKAVAERHHGRVECDSEPGRGSEFRIVLPAASP